jgi:hypothetical protein
VHGCTVQAADSLTINRGETSREYFWATIPIEYVKPDGAFPPHGYRSALTKIELTTREESGRINQ